MSLKYEPSSEQLHISANLFLDWELNTVAPAGGGVGGGLAEKEDRTADARVVLKIIDRQTFNGCTAVVANLYRLYSRSGKSLKDVRLY